MAKVVLTPDRITKLVEMINNKDVFVVFHGETQIVEAYSTVSEPLVGGQRRYNFEIYEDDKTPYIYYGGEEIDIRIFRRDDTVIF